jgi:hypothetical protein
MASCAEQLRSFLLDVLEGRPEPRIGESRGLRRLAASALAAARGGREVDADEVEDLVQEFLVKVLVLRAKRADGALAKEWAAMPAPRLYAYVRSTLKNLAVEQSPAWNTQRALRDVVKAALAKGLPVAAGLPATIEQRGRFERRLVAAACAELVARGVPADQGALTTALMAEYALGVSTVEESEAEALEGPAPTALDTLSAVAGGVSLAAGLEHKVGRSTLELLRTRRGGIAAVVKRFNLRLKAAYARCAKAEKRLVAAVREEGATADEARLALGLLGVITPA